jgi:predicted RecA/RadA family phage recombinase
MAANEVFKYGDWLVLPVPAGTKAGNAVAVGDLVGVAQTDRDADGNASVALTGVYDLLVTGATTPGTPVFITPGGALNITAAGNKLYGHATATKTAAAAVIPVRLAGHSNGTQA